MTTSHQSPIIWRAMRRLSNRLIARYHEREWIAGRVMLLTTRGRVSGLPRVTPLQYELVDGVCYAASARGDAADWVKNLRADPHVTLQIGERRVEGIADVIDDPQRIADFLAIRLQRHPLMMRAILLLEGVPPWAGRRALLRAASGLTLVGVALED